MRFALTARTLARKRAQGFEALNELTAMNVNKVTRYRKDGVEDLEREIGRLQLQESEEKKSAGNGKKTSSK
jgi:large subunit ribosomal protein L17